MTKLEIFDCAVNEITSIEGLEGQAECLEELWINNNMIVDWKNIEYIGSTLKNIRNLYMAGNPCNGRGKEFKDKVRQTIPCLKELEGNPFDRPVYMYAP